MSSICESFYEMDIAFRESYYTYVAGNIMNRHKLAFHDIGTYQYLISHYNDPFLKDYSLRIINPLVDKPEVFDTVVNYVLAEGDIGVVSETCRCHANTVRYRLSKAKELTGQEEMPDPTFYETIASAVKIHLINEFLK